jgi:diguanylate cyclase (GGDEF)-like protein
MPSPGASAPPRSSIEDSYLELLADALEGLDVSARGQFLQRYIKIITHLDLGEAQAIQLWDEALTRRRELSQHGRVFSLKAALVDVLAAAGVLHVPVLIEYEELKKLERNAVTDPLTGLYNRRLFDETLDKELNRARRYAHPLALVILDLHRFKEVNDKHGHPKGDEVLQAAARTLQKTLRTSDFAFRIGGDEFALVLPQTDAEQAVALSRRVGVVFAEALQPLELSISVSMDHGVATFPQDGDQTDQLIRIADERLYLLKHADHSASYLAPSAAVVAPPAPPPAKAAPAATPAPISIESGRVPEKPQPDMQAAVSAAAAGMAGIPSLPEAPRVYAVQRKAERVSMTGTNAYAVLGDKGSRRARVLDLGFGGVALELDTPEELPENLLAVLHVPILPPVRVNLKAVWTRKMSEGSFRIGCCFVS